ncbi:hypothetical protein LINPERPRIM_LOCUS13119 [Linum perenne]
MVKACLQCGDRGFSLALIHCQGCKLHVVHRYCLNPLPDFVELVLWFCEDCQPKFARLRQSSKQRLSGKAGDYHISVKGNDYAILRKEPVKKGKRRVRRRWTKSSKRRSQNRKANANASSLTKVDVIRLKVSSLSQIVQPPCSKTAEKDVELLKQNDESMSQVQCLETDLDVEVRRDCVVGTCDDNEKHEEQDGLGNGHSNDASLCERQPMEVDCSKAEGEEDKSMSCVEHLDAELPVDVQLVCGVETHNDNEKHEEQIRLRTDDSNEASNCDHQPIKVNCSKVREQDDKIISRVEHLDADMAVEVERDCVAATHDNNEIHEEQIRLRNDESNEASDNNGKEMHKEHERLKNDELNEASLCDRQPDEVNCSKVRVQDIDFGNCNILDGRSKVDEHAEPLTSKYSQETDHVIQDGNGEPNLQKEDCQHNITNSQQPVSDALHNIIALPIKDTSWRGSLSIVDRVFGTPTRLVAHLSSLACSRVTEATKSLPEVLFTKLLPRQAIWPKGFQKCSPGGNSIALYFFPDSERDGKVFDKLVKRMMDQDLGIKASLEDAELLIYSSRVLPMEYWVPEQNVYVGSFQGEAAGGKCSSS